MANLHKASLVDAIEARLGEPRKIGTSNSLYSVAGDTARIYFRYSKVHPEGRTFFGLREIDLRELAGRRSFICLLTDDGGEPLFIPYADFEEVFHRAQVADDGQYKVQLCRGHGTRELYIPRMGRFNVDGFVGLDALFHSVQSQRAGLVPPLSHCQVQTLLAGIGRIKGFDIYIPSGDASQLDWALTPRFELRGAIPSGFDSIAPILSEIDVLWVAAGRDTIEGLFEVEHSTPIYSGLLRFNDVLLSDPRVSRFFVVSNDARRELFARQVFRPTFRRSGLSEVTSFLEYANVFEWHSRLSPRADHAEATSKNDSVHGG